MKRFLGIKLLLNIPKHVMLSATTGTAADVYVAADDVERRCGTIEYVFGLMTP